MSAGLIICVVVESLIIGACPRPRKPTGYISNSPNPCTRAAGYVGYRVYNTYRDNDRKVMAEYDAAARQQLGYPPNNYYGDGPPGGAPSGGGGYPNQGGGGGYRYGNAAKGDQTLYYANG
jgi:hypothetical protein